MEGCFMKNSTKLGLKIIDVFEEDDIKETITSYSDNFSRLDALYQESYLNIESLPVGSEHKKNQIYYNSDPAVDKYVGWINLQTGLYAPKWEKRKEYKVGDLIRTTNGNGHVYQCVVEGTSAFNEPLFPETPNTEIDDLHTANTWLAEHVYSVGDIVISSANTSIYYECITAGKSGLTEPTWGSQTGVSIVDETVVWLVNKTVKWKESGKSCFFRPFGLIV